MEPAISHPKEKIVFDFLVIEFFSIYPDVSF